MSLTDYPFFYSKPDPNIQALKDENAKLRAELEEQHETYSQELAHLYADRDNLRAALAAANERVRELEEDARWIPVSERLPVNEGQLDPDLCAYHWNGNDGDVVSCEFLARYIWDEDQIYFDVVSYNFETGKWELMVGGEALDITVTHWQPLPPTPSDE